MRVDYTNLSLEPPDKGQSSSRAAQTADTGNGVAGSSASGSTAVLNSGSDQASFSFDQAAVQSLAAQVLAQPEIREAKVQSLQQAIGSGEYSILPSQIADALAGEFGAVSG